MVIDVVIVFEVIRARRWI